VLGLGVEGDTDVGTSRGVGGYHGHVTSGATGGRVGYKIGCAGCGGFLAWLLVEGGRERWLGGWDG
jgi:hypothetical protein